jgi:uncharacterized protein YbaR (Trm112 family)
MVSQDLIEILRCPACVRTTGGELNYHKEAWFICKDCGRKYPIRDDIPVMLIDEGDKWVSTAVDALPIPPPAN